MKKYSADWYKNKLLSLREKIDCFNGMFNEHPKEAKILLDDYGKQYDDLRKEAYSLGYGKELSEF